MEEVILEVEEALAEVEVEKDFRADEVILEVEEALAEEEEIEMKNEGKREVMAEGAVSRKRSTSGASNLKRLKISFLIFKGSSTRTTFAFPLSHSLGSMTPAEFPTCTISFTISCLFIML